MRKENIPTGLREGCDQTPTGVERLCVDETLSSTGKAEEKIRQESSWCKGLLGGRLRMGISERLYHRKGRKSSKKWRGPFMITEVHQEGRFYRLSTGRAAHYENIKPHNPSTEDWCIPADMEEGGLSNDGPCL